MKSSNKHVLAFAKHAAEAATGSDKPYALMIKEAGLAAVEGAITSEDQPAFYKALEKARPQATHKTMLDSRKSEAWSCVKLAFEFKYCAKDIFANLEKATPTPTGIYDIACSIRGKAHFAEGAACEKKAIGLNADSGKAPTVEAMQAAIRHSNAYRNDLSGGGKPKTLADMAKQARERFEKYRDGKVNKRDPKTGELLRVGGKPTGDLIKLPGDKSKPLGDVIAALAALESHLAPAAKSNGKTNVVPMKRKAA